MKVLRISVLLVMVGVMVSLLVGCGQAQVDLKVGATAVPHAEILEFVQPLLAEQGIDMQIIVFNDYVQPNLALSEGELDANFFQHLPYLEAFREDHGLDLISIGKVHIEPMGFYSHKFSQLAELSRGAQIAIPNDVSQVGRALALLAKHGLITLKPDVGVKGTVEDITANPWQLRLTLLDAAMLPRVLDDPQVSAAVINGNFALEAGLNPVKDALFLEDGDSPYANVLVVNRGSENDPAIQTLLQLLRSDAVKRFIDQEYQGAVIPA